MALSDYERQMLEQLEAQLKGDDPTLAESLGTEDLEHTRLALSIRHLVLGLIVAVIGLGVVVVSVASELIIVGIVGGVTVWLGLMYIVRGMSRVGVEAGGHAQRPTSHSGESFMERQKRAFDRRREEGGR
ncbi:DUF3040 domain-containing protein [Arcanobacterium pinnipediorum]|uniref:DUF3040 domain-containing protein n=1 Tax=Arcanobacterium pinnipediorum TaxID=1503041 RepID=A0ABY5AJS4_9ACTO|nr:DUF3040 domain-containing protein [Arcanobacterium pinnipediorum]USR80021.1 DUF3040 domain-containing protein [Arcanobacterium pinnipediorum]